MKPQKINNAQSRFFEQRLSDQLNPSPEIYMLANMIDWEHYEKEFGQLYSENNSREPKPIRLTVGLIMLQNMFNCSDRSVVRTWIENPYWQYFCGFDFLQWKFPVDPSSLTDLDSVWEKMGVSNFFIKNTGNSHNLKLLNHYMFRTTNL